MGTEAPRGWSMRPPGSPSEAAALARGCYSEGMRWIVRLDAAGTPEGRIRCATTASAFFDAGRLALALGAIASAKEKRDE